MEKTIKLTTTELDLITTICVFVKGEVSTYDDVITIHPIKKGAEGFIQINREKKEVGFVDFGMNIKTYFAIVGLAMCRNYTTEDYFQ